MRMQLEIQDRSGFTLVIHAARAGDVALLGAVIEEIFELKVFWKRISSYIASSMRHILFR